MLRSRVRWISAHERTLNIHPSIMHVLVLIIINLHTKFEVPCFTHSKDMIVVPKFNKSPLPLTNPREAVPQAPLPASVLYTDVDGQCDKLRPRPSPVYHTDHAPKLTALETIRYSRFTCTRKLTRWPA